MSAGKEGIELDIVFMSVLTVREWKLLTLMLSILAVIMWSFCFNFYMATKKYIQKKKAEAFFERENGPELLMVTPELLTFSEDARRDITSLYLVIPNVFLGLFCYKNLGPK